MQVTAQLPLRPAQHPFSTTTVSQSVLKKKASPGIQSQRTGKGIRGSKIVIKKKAVVKTGRPPAPGERKAMRNRIILSNTNALPVQMEDLETDTLADKRLIGSVVGLPENVVDSLRAAEAFKITQGWGLFRRPAMLIRDETTQLAERMFESEQKKTSVRMIIDGDRVSGKSMMLLQAMTAAFLRNWIVLHIPEGKSHVFSPFNYH